MATKKPPQVRRDPRPADAASESAKPQGGQFLVFRETVESIVVAFVLAFLFRTFEAEAFVIPTGSMSPSLLGQHKDVSCSQCGYDFRTTASSEGEDRDRMMAELPSLRGMRAEELKSRIASFDVVGGMCPMCRYLMPMRPDVPPGVMDQVDAEDDVDYQPSYPGDRILVNKYGFDFSEPKRWDVVVFKFPGDGNMNYIKRLTGLPGEVVRVYQGDLFTKPLNAADAEFRIERKPADKVAAMLHEVHDTDYEPAALHEAGWPLRWAATTPNGWTMKATAGEQAVEQQFAVDLKPDAEEAWIRYRHLVPNTDNWQAAKVFQDEEAFKAAIRREGLTYTRDEWRQTWHEHVYPQLITDFNAYNARLLRAFAERDGWRILPNSGQNSGSLGTEWVGDLAVECDVDVEDARGEIVLDLVEAGYHFRATINLKDGKAAFSIVDGRTGEKLDFDAARQTPITSPGEYRLRFANVDDQLLLWVDGELIEDGAAVYDPDKLFEGGRDGMLPWAGGDESDDQGDLAPAGVAARGAKLTVDRLAVLRDIYYIATKHPDDLPNYSTDYAITGVDPEELFSQPDKFEHFSTRKKRDFPVEEGQFLVLGDNSPESKDCRLWMMGPSSAGVPGGPYLDRRLLIGKAICVFWPHSWGSIPGLPMLPGWPNFSDMRIVR
jgi:signal peptidase I